MAARSRHAPRLPVRGEIFRTTIVLQNVLNYGARRVAGHHGIDLGLSDVDYQAAYGENERPFVVLGSSQQGLHTFPFSTFHGTLPESWNLFLREIVVPMGDRARIPGIFDDRRSFDTHPTWTHPGGLSTYLIPIVTIVPYHSKLTRYRVVMDSTVLDELESHCEEIMQRLEADERDSVWPLLKSYVDRPTDRYRAQQSARAVARDGTRPSQHGSACSSVAGSAAPSTVLSFPRSTCSQFSGAWSVGLPQIAQPASIHGVLQVNPPHPNAVQGYRRWPAYY